MGTPLGDFLRDRRDSTPPETVGLPAGARRRAPGLRRSELAALAGISVEYLVRIEQGRDRNPSMQVIEALTDALRLDATAADHLRQVAKATSGNCRLTEPVDLRLGPSVLKIIDLLEPGLAVAITYTGELLAWTATFDLLARPLGLLDVHGEHPNLTRYVFTDPRAREAFPDWDHIADARVAELWHAERTGLVDELSAAAGAQFTARLARHRLPGPRPQRWRHPEVGELRLTAAALGVTAADGQQVLVLLPADHETESAVHRLRRTAAGALRAV